MKSISHKTLLLAISLLCWECGNGEKPVSTAGSHDLFKKYINNPVFDIGDEVPLWRCNQAANVSILEPSVTPDGKWRLFLRGTGYDASGYRSSIGMFDQDSSTFNPFGNWKEYPENPVLPHGTFGSYDEVHVLEGSVRKCENGNIYLYFMGRDKENRASICGAISNDGGFSFSKFTSNPLKLHVGPNDIIFKNNLYYVFFGDAKWNGNSFDEKLQIWLSVSDSPDTLSVNPSIAIKAGDNGTYDGYAVNGAQIFKVTGDPRWFMIYHVSKTNFDYPERFHAAYSTDLINWTKVANLDVPLLTRGEIGEWDQGAIWTGSVFEYKNNLYVYYEGFGSFSMDLNRDQVYYQGGYSRVGVAYTSVKDFLSWVNSKE